MAYATLEGMLTEYGKDDLVQVTDYEPPYTGEINMMRLNKAMKKADGQVDAYLSKVVNVPLINPSEFICGLACNLARYHVVKGSSRLSKRDQDDYDEAKVQLQLIADGKLGLGNSTAQNAVTQSPNMAQMTSGRPTVFGNGGW